MARKTTQEIFRPEDDPRFHDTYKFLRRYRDATYSLKVVVRQMEQQFRMQYGEQYYWILYYAFLSPQELQNTEEILEKLEPHIRNISYRTYYRKRRAAIEALSAILWGFTAKETINILDKLFPNK